MAKITKVVGRQVFDSRGNPTVEAEVFLNNKIKASAIGPSDSKLSEKVYGRIFFRNKSICISPIKGLSTHLTEGVMSPLIGWESISEDYIFKMKKLDIW